jgi:hypothetical protein
LISIIVFYVFLFFYSEPGVSEKPVSEQKQAEIVGEKEKFPLTITKSQVQRARKNLAVILEDTRLKFQGRIFISDKSLSELAGL